MAVDAVLKFMQKTAADESCRQELITLLGVGDGDISNAKELDLEEAQALTGERGVLVADFAAKQGFQFTVADLSTVVSMFQRLQSGELSEAEFSKALGLQDSTSNTGSRLPVLEQAVDLVYMGIRYKSKPAPAASSQVLQVLQFMEKTAADEQLRQQLKGLLDTGDGDISKAAEIDAEEARALKSERGALVAEFAFKHGFQFSMADLISVIDALQRVQAGELSEQEFSKLLNLSSMTGGLLPALKQIGEMTYRGIRYRGTAPSIGQDNTLQVVRFMEKTAADAKLRQQLQELIGGDGNISNPKELDTEETQALKGELGAQVAQFASKQGFSFTVSDLSAVVGAFQLVQAGKLSEDSCIRILGLSDSNYAAQSSLSTVKQTANLMYRGVKYKG
ncbi:MAG: hypothetical protein VKJ46_09645 [Leptolyngbyaceae bacterium]|nr:hypothetical protein [Leptolyngbyaceae bacterium]